MWLLLQVNGLLAVAELAAEAALPAVALDALARAQEELPGSCAAPQVAGRLHVAAARAWGWQHQALGHATALAAQHAAALLGGGGDAATDEAAAAAEAEARHTAEQAAEAEAEALRRVRESCAAARAARARPLHLADSLEAAALFRAGEWRAGVEAQARALASAPGHRLPLLSGYVQLAEGYRRLGLPEQAANVFKQVRHANCWARARLRGTEVVHEEGGAAAASSCVRACCAALRRRACRARAPRRGWGWPRRTATPGRASRRTPRWRRRRCKTPTARWSGRTWRWPPPGEALRVSASHSKGRADVWSARSARLFAWGCWCAGPRSLPCTRRRRCAWAWRTPGCCCGWRRTRTKRARPRSC